MNINFDIIERIAEEIRDIKSVATLGQVDTYHAKWWKQYFTKNSEILTLFINHVYNTSSSDQEIADRFLQYAISECCHTPFNLSIERSCVNEGKLSAIQKKFPNIHQVRYVRPFKIAPRESLLKKIFSGFFPKMDPSFGNDKALGTIYKVFPKVQKLSIHLSGNTKFGSEGITALPPFCDLKSLRISYVLGSFPVYPDSEVLLPIDSSFQSLFCQYGNTLEHLDLLQIGHFFRTFNIYNNLFRLGQAPQFKYIPQKITNLGIALSDFTELAAVLDRCKNLHSLKVCINCQRPNNGLSIPCYTSLQTLEIIQSPADVESIKWFFTGFPNMTTLKVMGKYTDVFSLDEWPSSTVLRNLCIKVGRPIAGYDNKTFLQKFPALESHEIRFFPNQTEVSPNSPSLIPK